MYAFDLVRPSTLAEAIEALKEEDSQALGGGQTLIPTLKARLAMPARLVCLSRVEELKGTGRDADGRIVIRGATTHAAVARELGDLYPGLAELAGDIGDPAVRNRGTIGGSLANNDPSACYPAAVLASGATIVTDRREIEADAFFQGMFTTALEENELIVEVRFPVPQRGFYAKFIQRASRFPMTAVFVARFPDRVGVAVTGASEEGVFRWSEAEAALAGEFDAAAVEPLDPPDRPMISDMHGSGEYRAHLAKTLTVRAVRRLTQAPA